MKNGKLIIKTLFWVGWAAVVSTCVFFIVYNAQYLIGDDYELIRHTGSGKPFLPSGTIKPNIGRFFPFAYLVYDVLLLFGDGYWSAQSHYVIQAICFVVFVLCMTSIGLEVLKEVENIRLRYGIVAFFVALVVCLTLLEFCQCASTAWFGYTLLSVFMWLFLRFVMNGDWRCGVGALLVVNYLNYCGESSFVLPLALGVCGLLFHRKNKALKWFYSLLVVSAMVFLMLYAITILPHIETSYDGSHGSPDNMLKNALKMMWGQKMLIVLFLTVLVRMIDLFRNKKGFLPYDALLLAAVACCCGNFMLRLNWSLYYTGPILLALPSILWIINHYLKAGWTLVLFAVFALACGKNIPFALKRNQRHRTESYKTIVSLSKQIDTASDVFWYAPDADENRFEWTVRKWKYNVLCTYLGWYRQETDFMLKQATGFDRIANTVWVTALENELLFPDDNKLRDEGEELFYLNTDGIAGYRVLSGDNAIDSK